MLSDSPPCSDIPESLVLAFLPAKSLLTSNQAAAWPQQAPKGVWVLSVQPSWEWGGVQTPPPLTTLLFLGEVSHPSVSGHLGPEILPLLGTDWPGHWDRLALPPASCPLPLMLWAGAEPWGGGACPREQVG